MKLSNPGRYAVSSCVAAALLAACGGSQPPIGAPGAMPQAPAIAKHAERGGSWMLSEAKSEDLLYVTNLGGLTVYSYPRGKLVGQLSDFPTGPGSDCVDMQGDVYVTDGNYVFEYAHGRSKPQRVLADPAGAASCAVDPATGNLATAGFVASSFGGVEVFKNAIGSPAYYSNRAFRLYSSCAYDNKGNLFVDGMSARRHRFILAELLKGGSRLQTVKLDQHIHWPGSVQWHHAHLAVGGFSTPRVYQFAINRRNGIKIGTTQLGAPARHVYAFVIEGARLIAVGASSADSVYDYVLFFKYPAGGSPTKLITQGLDSPRGAAVSLAPSR